jgi:hypothetical protein
MKQLLTVLLSLTILAACNNKKAEVAGEKTSTEKTDIKPPDDGKGSKDKDAMTTGWPEKDRNDFLSSCINEALKNIPDSNKVTRYCSCMLEKMEGEYPDVNKAATLTTEEISAMMTKYRDGCLGN